MTRYDANSLWKRLEEREGAWRIPVLATADADLGADARTVVLRECSPSARRLVFHSARDADKVRQLKRDNRGCLLVYDADAGIQLRLYGRLERINNRSLLDRAWQALADNQRKVYSLQRRVRGEENFALVGLTVDAMHLLELAADGENRASEFTWCSENAAGDAGGAWERKTVEP